eukprot:scaffold62_cov256-Pinguiococcus_pyrenoidosus.AAC.23
MRATCSRRRLLTARIAIQGYSGGAADSVPDRPPPRAGGRAQHLHSAGEEVGPAVHVPHHRSDRQLQLSAPAGGRSWGHRMGTDPSDARECHVPAIKQVRRWSRADDGVSCSTLTSHHHRYVAYFSFAEEILPFTDIIPTATLAWLRMYGPEVYDEMKATVIARREAREQEAIPAAPQPEITSGN